MTESAAVDTRPWWQRKNLGRRGLDAFKSALAAVLCLWLGQLLHLSHSYWAAISAIVVMGSDNAVTLTSSRDRLIGTAIGALVGWGTFYVWHGHYVMYGLAVLLCLLACSLLEYEKAGRLAAVAVTIIVLIQYADGPGEAAIARFLEVSLGIVVALAVTMIFPPWDKASVV